MVVNSGRMSPNGAMTGACRFIAVERSIQDEIATAVSSLVVKGGLSDASNGLTSSSSASSPLLSSGSILVNSSTAHSNVGEEVSMGVGLELEYEGGDEKERVCVCLCDAWVLLCSKRVPNLSTSAYEGSFCKGTATPKSSPVLPGDFAYDSSPGIAARLVNCLSLASEGLFSTFSNFDRSAGGALAITTSLRVRRGGVEQFSSGHNEITSVTWTCPHEVF